jgi:hypothetical protein
MGYPRTGSLLSAAMLASAAFALTACGSHVAGAAGGSSSASSSPGGSGPPTAAPPTSPGSPGTGPTASPPVGTCGTTVKPAPTGSVLTLSNRDNADTFCVPVGQQVTIFLNGSPTRLWSTIRSDSSSLGPSVNGRLMLRLGVTGAAFQAVHPGVAHLTSARTVCSSGPVHCDALAEFQVTVVISVPAQ